METQRNELIELVERNGWKATELDNYDFHKWSAESWVLESVWSPIGVKAYVHFELDPFFPPQESRPWAILVSDSFDRILMHENPKTYLTISLKHWKNEKLDLINFLEEIRNENLTKVLNQD
jgi:hypothetical protein